MPTAAAYIRVSTEDQMEFSPNSQLRCIQAYALNHHIELLPAHIYLDEGISGRNASKRPAFLQMIADAKRKPHPFDLILLWKFSRFARNRQDSIFYKSMLRRECGIDVISITEPLSPDPTSILIEALLEAMDEYYSVNLAQEVRRGMNEKFRRGEPLTALEARSLLPSREEFADLWRYLKGHGNEGPIEETERRLARNLARTSGRRETVMRTMVCLEVFDERGLIRLERNTDHLQIRLNSVEGKVDLEQSHIMRKLRSILE